jgi:hypothetical protein
MKTGGGEDAEEDQEESRRKKRTGRTKDKRTDLAEQKILKSFPPLLLSSSPPVFI